MKKTFLILTILVSFSIIISCDKAEVEEDADDNTDTIQETDFRDQYLGSYIVTDSTFTPDGEVDIQTKTVDVTINADADNRINLDGIFDNVVNYAKLSDSSFVVPLQYADEAQQEEVSGIGSFNGDKIYYRLNIDNNTIIIIGRGSK